MNEPSVSVVVPAYNAESTIADCITALINQDFPEPFEVLVIDDGSTDRTADLAQGVGARVLRRTRGRPAAARNTGINAAQGDIICFTDADCIPRADWLREITAPFSDPSVAACKGSYATRQPQLVARFVQFEYEDKYDLLRKQESIDFIDTYSAAYRRRVLLDNGGFDERFDYLEDQELSFRLAERGSRMVFQEPAIVEHLHADTVGAYMRKKATIGYWKAQVVRLHPSRLTRDSHTPQIMKVQMALMGLVPALAAAGLLASLAVGVRRLFFAPALMAAIALLATTLPFAVKVWPKDHGVALAAPLLLAARALALSWGYARGLLSPLSQLDNVHSPIVGWKRVLKRVIDVVGSLMGLLFTLLVLPLIALIIKLDSEGPLLFRQQRVGELGRPFTLLKFRSMQVGAEERWPELIAMHGLKEPVLKLVIDPRLTRAGRLLRRWSLDELPQFWNVLKGEMSLVGPRPEEPRIVAHYTDWHRQRLSVRPGITGLMQVSGRADLTLDERVAYDLAYIDDYSLRRDIAILLKTIPVIVRGNGAR